MITSGKAMLLLAALGLSCSQCIAQTERVFKTPATTMEQAIIDARKSLVQRRDPMMPVTQVYHTPVVAKKPVKKSRKWFVDPPPPVVPTGAINGIPVSQYGSACGGVSPYFFVEEKETLSDKVRLLAVMDGKVVLSLPAGLRAKKNWPSTITMSEGEKFDTLALVAVRRDSVTFEEDNKRYVKMLAPVQ